MVNVEVISDSEMEDAGSVCDVSECAPARVFDWIVSLDVVCGLPTVLSSTFQLNLSVSQIPSFSRCVVVVGACEAERHLHQKAPLFKSSRHGPDHQRNPPAEVEDANPPWIAR